MRLHRLRSPCLLTFSALVAAGCNDRTATTAPRAATNAALAAGGPNNARVKVKMLQLSSNTLRINGPSATATMTLGNSGPAIQLGVSIRVEIVQGAATRQTTNAPTQCNPGDAPGFLPTGSCDMTVDVTTSNAAAGSGTLVPGAAIFVLHVFQNDGGTETELASKSINVNLVTTPSITALTLASTTLAIGGPSVGYTATLQNPANSLQGVLLQGIVVQGTTRRAAGGLSVTCGGGIGVFPPGTCVIHFTATASNSTGGTGTLIPGAAVFELSLIQSNGVTTTTFDVETVAITLVSSIPTITAITPTSTFIVLGAGFTSYTATIQNPGFSRSGVLLQGWISQGSARRAAGGTQINCTGGTATVLPPGTCTAPGDIVAMNGAASRTGTLVFGPATFELELIQFDGVATNILDTKTLPITLVATTPSIVSVVLTSTDIQIGGSTAYTATLYNPTGVSLSGVVVIQGELVQGTTHRAAGGKVLDCAASGVMPTGVCVVTFTVNTTIECEPQTLVPGGASFVLNLMQGTAVLDTKTTSVNLTSP